MTVLIGSAVVVLGAVTAGLSSRLNACRFRRVVVAARLAAGQDEPQLRAPARPIGEMTTESIPLAIRDLLPAPPVVGFVMHHTCSSCRDLWREVRDAPDLRDVVLVYSAPKRHILGSTGLLREPSVALPEDLMDELPSSLTVAIGNEWRLLGRTIAQSIADVRDVAMTLTIED